MSKAGLVLEGGAMRGMYTAGVLDTFLDYEKEISFDKIAGVSAGALFGVNYLSKQKGRAIRYNKKFNKNKHYMGLLPLLTEKNIISPKFAYGKVPYELDVFDDETFKMSSAAFYSVATNIVTGKGEYFKINSVFEQMDTLRASGSLPFVSQPVKIGNDYYLDGGISDSIPFEFLFSRGVSKAVVILTRDMSYKKEPINQKLVNTFYKKYPHFKDTLNNRHNMYNSQLEKLKILEKEGKVFVLRPSTPINIGKMEKDGNKLQWVYDLGIKDAKDNIEKIIEFVK